MKRVKATANRGRKKPLKTSSQKPKGTRIKEKATISGKEYELPKGVCMVYVRGVRKIVVYSSGGTRSYYEETSKGLKAALNHYKRIEKEKIEHGQRFGSISTDERQAIELWREYRDDCQREGCNFEPMSVVMKESLDIYRHKSMSKYFHEVVREYVNSVERKGVCKEHLLRINQRARKINQWMGDKRICHITSNMIDDFLNTIRGRNGKECEKGTRKGYMGLIKAIFAYAIRFEYTEKNPVSALSKPIVKNSVPEILTLEESRTILQYAAKKELSYLPGLVLGLFCGIRPAELARLRYADLTFHNKKLVYLNREITKTNVDRYTKLRPNVIKWLKYAKGQGINMNPNDYVLPGDTEEHRVDRHPDFLKRIKAGCKIKFSRDAIRHTTGSMLSALIGKGDAAEELGNDVRTLTKHYRQAITKEEAKEFYKISPDILAEV